MTKKLVIYLSFLNLTCFAQYGEWTWMGGDSSINKAGVYGTQLVPSANNFPGARYEAENFTDNQYNFWLFGGLGYISATSARGYYNDLWKYNPSTNEWTWMKGPQTLGAAAVYGTKGVPSSTNNPPGKMAGCSWSQVLGCFWLFGGRSTGSAVSNDLWRYDIATNEWTWMKGGPGSIESYGILGIPSLTNNPPARDEVTCTWLRGENLWFFGGRNAAGQHLNDLWKYNIITNEWTWMSGDSIPNQPGDYGIRGVMSNTNKPGARSAYCSWVDKNGDLWLFGGVDQYYFNDLWKYDVIANQWIWIHGDSTQNTSKGNYGKQCVSSSFNVPGHRTENKACWVDSTGNFWMYGGHNSSGDLWKYDPNMNEWTWVQGDSIAVPANYGVKGISSIYNKPGVRDGAPSWKGQDGSLWILGGIFTAGSKKNDLWRYVPDTGTGKCIQTSVINRKSIPEFSVYPNPAQSICVISLKNISSENFEIKIFDILGKEIYISKITSEKTELDIQHFTPGIYFIRLNGKSKKYTVKLLKL